MSAKSSKAGRVQTSEEARVVGNLRKSVTASASSIILDADVDALTSWPATGYDRLTYAIRASRLSMLSMILKDLDGYEVDDNMFGSMTFESFLMFKGNVSSLVTEALEDLVSAFLCVPELLWSSTDGYILSVGDLSDAGVSFKLSIDECYAGQLGGYGAGYFETLYWLLSGQANRISELASFLGVPAPSISGAKQSCEYLPTIIDAYLDAWPAARTLIECGVDEVDGELMVSNVVPYDDLPQKNRELAEYMVNWISRLSDLSADPSATAAQLARACYDLAGNEKVPSWLEKLEAAEQNRAATDDDGPLMEPI